VQFTATFLSPATLSRTFAPFANGRGTPARCNPWLLASGRSSTSRSSSSISSQAQLVCYEGRVVQVLENTAAKYVNPTESWRARNSRVEFYQLDTTNYKVNSSAHNALETIHASSRILVKLGCNHLLRLIKTTCYQWN